MSHRSLVFLSAWMAFGLTSCTKYHSPAAPNFLKQHVGDFCVVQFRRDALGAGANLPISPSTGEINGASVTLRGKLLAAEGEGLVIEDSVHFRGGTVWIPYHVILSVAPEGQQ